MGRRLESDAERSVMGRKKGGKARGKPLRVPPGLWLVGFSLLSDGWVDNASEGPMQEVGLGVPADLCGCREI